MHTKWQTLGCPNNLLAQTEVRILKMVLKNLTRSFNAAVAFLVF